MSYLAELREVGLDVLECGGRGKATHEDFLGLGHHLEQDNIDLE